MPWPSPLAPMGFIYDDGTSFMSPYLAPLASLPDTVTVPSLPYGQWAALSAAIYNLGGTSCVLGGSALHSPTPHDTAFMGPRLGDIPYGQWAARSAAIYDLGRGARVSLGGVPCAPLPPMTLLSRGLAARIQKRIFLLGCIYAMGFNWQPRTLHSSMGGKFALRHLHPRAAPLFRCCGVIMGVLHSPPLLLLVIMGGLQPPPLVLLAIVAGLPSPPLPLGL